MSVIILIQDCQASPLFSLHNAAEEGLANKLENFNHKEVIILSFWYLSITS